jgi:hypothetical protein
MNWFRGPAEENLKVEEIEELRGQEVHFGRHGLVELPNGAIVELGEPYIPHAEVVSNSDMFFVPDQEIELELDMVWQGDLSFLDNPDIQYRARRYIPQEILDLALLEDFDDYDEYHKKRQAANPDRLPYDPREGF